MRESFKTVTSKAESLEASIERTERSAEFMRAAEILSDLKQFEGQTVVGQVATAEIEASAKEIHDMVTEQKLTLAEQQELGILDPLKITT